MGPPEFLQMMKSEGNAWRKRQPSVFGRSRRRRFHSRCPSLDRAMPISFSDLPDQIVLRILSLAFQNQIVTFFPKGRSSTGVACSLPPCPLTSKQIARVAKHVPIRLLSVQLEWERSPQIVRLLHSLRCPIQILDFSDGLTSRFIDWTPMLEFITQCPHPDQVQTVRMIHRQQCGCSSKGTVSQCSHLQGIISKVQKRMPQCKGCSQL